MGDHPVTECINVSEIDGVTVVRFHDLNADVSGCEPEKIESLAEELFAVAQQDPVILILDFEGQVFVPWALFNSVMVRLHTKLGGKLRMCNLPSNVAEQYELIRLSTLFRIDAGLDDALAAAKRIEEET